MKNYNIESSPRPAAIREMATVQLISCFLDTTPEPPSIELATVRGWMLDELEERNPDAFDAWMLSDDNEDSDILKYYNV